MLSLRRTWSASSITTGRSFEDGAVARGPGSALGAGSMAARSAETIPGVPQIMYDVLSAP